MSDPGVYRDYWRRKRLLDQGPPRFPLRRWWESEGLCDIEQVCFEAVRGAASLLDVGAGDLRIRRKLQAAGYTGEYHTQDVGREYDHTYASLAEVDRHYDAIMCLDVLEHLPLEEGLATLDRLVKLLNPGGRLVIQTPNARCIRSPLAWDMTHVHLYNLDDLWAYLTAAGLDSQGFRVAFGRPPRSPVAWVRFALATFVTSRVLGADFADNVVLIARRPPSAAG
jgi:hypothetical protein